MAVKSLVCSHMQAGVLYMLDSWGGGIYIYIYIYIYIQGVTGGMDQTSGECSLGQTIPI